MLFIKAEYSGSLSWKNLASGQPKTGEGPHCYWWGTALLPAMAYKNEVLDGQIRTSFSPWKHSGPVLGRSGCLLNPCWWHSTEKSYKTHSKSAKETTRTWGVVVAKGRIDPLSRYLLKLLKLNPAEWTSSLSAQQCNSLIAWKVWRQKTARIIRHATMATSTFTNWLQLQVWMVSFKSGSVRFSALRFAPSQASHCFRTCILHYVNLGLTFPAGLLCHDKLWSSSGMDFQAITAWKNSATRKVTWFLGFLCLLGWKLRRWSVLAWEGSECSLSNIPSTANAEGASLFISLQIKIANMWFSQDEFSGICSRAKHGPRWTRCPLPPWKLWGLPLDASAPCSIATWSHFSQGSRHPPVSHAVHCIARFVFRLDL